MFTVQGRVNGQPYTLGVTDTRLIGTHNIMDVINQAEGTRALVTPTGPAPIVDTSDPASILACLYAHTQVTAVTGAAPVIDVSVPTGAIP